MATVALLPFVARHGIRRAHFLRATSPPVVATLLGLGRQAGLEFVSYDSTTAATAGVNRAVLVPTTDGLAYTLRRERAQGRAAREYLLEQCPCWSCQGLRRDRKQVAQVVGGGYNEYWTYRFIFHNMLTLLRTHTALATAAATDPEGLLREVLGARRHAAVLRAFDGREPSQVAVGLPRSLLEWIA